MIIFPATSRVIDRCLEDAPVVMLGRVHVRKFAKNQQTPNTASLSPTRTTLPRILHCCAVQEAKYIESDKAHTYNRYNPHSGAALSWVSVLTPPD
jgi:hypothetical protein